MTYLITGATGFIGTKLIRRLVTDGGSVHYLARKRSSEFDSQVSFHCWETNEEAPLNSLPRLDAIIHLTGEPIAQRWNPEVKKRIHDSRVIGTRNLVSAIGKLRHRPEVLVSASAVGYYGDRADQILTEESSPGSDFLAKLCLEWEAEASKAREFGLRVVPIRFGTVLGAEGGALPLMVKPAKWGLSATFGSGKQWMSWIHIDDLVNMLLFAATTRSVNTILNGVAPEPVTNALFTKALAHALNRPAFLTAPKFALQAILGEMSEFLFESLRVIPEAAQRAGFSFVYPSLAGALLNLAKQF